MAQTDGRAENQHYVPQMLLRNFTVAGRGKQDQIHVFDKRDDRAFRTGTQNVAAERRFYDLSADDGVTVSLEPSLTKLEEGAAEAFRKLLGSRRLDALLEIDRAWIALFLAWQKLRGKNFREDQLHLDAALRDLITASGGSPQKVEGYTPFTSEEELKAFHLGFLASSAADFAAHMVNKRWVLFDTDADHPFWISDTPVVLHNDEDFGPYGNIGLAVRGIQVYLPVSPTIMLGLWCFSQEEKIRAAGMVHDSFCAGWRRSAAYEPAVDDVIFRHMAGGASPLRQSLLKALDAGTPIECNPANVMFFNSLQVRWAERFVFSSQPDFSLALQMIRDHPECRSGPRMTIG